MLSARNIAARRITFDDYRLISPEDFREEDRRTKIAAGDVLLTIVGVIGRTAVVRNDHLPFTLQRSVSVLRSEAAESRYLAYTLEAPITQRHLQENAKGTAQKGIYLKALADVPLALAPLAEQHRIADKLDAVLARVDAANDRLARVAPLLKRFRQSVLATATSGRLTEEWRQAAGNQLGAGTSFLDETQGRKLEWARQNPEHNETSRVLKRVKAFAGGNRSPTLPESWVFAALEDVVLMVVDCHNKTAPYTPSGIPLVRTTNVREGHFQWDELRYVDSDIATKWSRRCTPEPGDLIYTREAPMGEIAIIPPSISLCLGQRTMLFRPVPGLMSAEFLRLVVMSPAFKAYAESQAVGTGVKHLRVGSVSELRVPVPCRVEQAEIVRRVEILFTYADRLEARLQTVQTATERLTPSLLAKAFRGELVPQDPNDEAASELLQRLQADSRPGTSKRSKRKPE
jgi:type I restriction enzyme S subunit